MEEYEAAVMNIINEVEEDVKRIAEKNIKEAKRKGRPLIDPLLLSQLDRVMQTSFINVANAVPPDIVNEYNPSYVPSASKSDFNSQKFDVAAKKLKEKASTEQLMEKYKDVNKIV